MHIRSSVLLALMMLLLPFTYAFALAVHSPPDAYIIREDFSPNETQFEPVTGRWTVSGGTYGDNLDSNPDISVITSYPSEVPTSPPEPKITYDDFTVRARVRNQGSTADAYAGLVYGYQDQQNYYEAVVSATGVVQVRSVVNGQTTVLGSLEVPDIERNQWCEIEVHWKNGVTAVKIDGRAVDPVQQSEFTSGLIGLVTHTAVARFDKLVLTVPFGDLEFLETFDNAQPSTTFTPASGQWSVANGSYGSGVQQTSISFAPIHTGSEPFEGETFQYTLRARMLNGYGGPGNLMGLVFDYVESSESPPTYTEVTFSPTGVVKLNRAEGGATHTVATASYNGRQKVPFEVQLENGPQHFAVVVDGVPLFTDVPIADVNPDQSPGGKVGLITHWAPGRFDNVQFFHGFFQPCSFTFDNPPPSQSIVSGSWDTNGGTLNDTSVHSSDIVDLDCPLNALGDHVGTDFIYRAKVMNQFGASGNLVGLLYGYQGRLTAKHEGFYAGDYFEVVFSPTGNVQMNKFIEGVRYPVASGTYNVPRNTFFDVQVIRSGISTTVKVNGSPVIENVPQGDLRGGSIGMITHWARGRFDDVTVTENVVRPESQL